MTLLCIDCGSDRIEDTAEPWKHGKVAICPYCSSLLYDALGKPLDPGADRGWCHNPHPGGTRRSVDYHRDRFDWRDRDLYPDADAPVFEAREMAVPHADEHVEMANLPEQLDEEQR